MSRVTRKSTKRAESRPRIEYLISGETSKTEAPLRMAKYSDWSESKKAGDRNPIQRTQPCPCIRPSMGSWKGVLRRKGARCWTWVIACSARVSSRAPPALHVFQDLAGCIRAGQAREMAAGMGPRAAQKEARHRHRVLLVARCRAQEEHLVQGHFAVMPLAAGQVEPGL